MGHNDGKASPLQRALDIFGDDEQVGASALAEFLGISRRTVTRMASKGKLIPVEGVTPHKFQVEDVWQLGDKDA